VIQTNDARILTAAWQNNNLWATMNEGCLVVTDSKMHSCGRIVEFSTTNSTVLQDLDLQLSENSTGGAPGMDVYYPAITLNSNGGVFIGFSFSNKNFSPGVGVFASPNGDLVFNGTGGTLQSGTAVYNRTRFGGPGNKCVGGSNAGNSCTSDADCPGTAEPTNGCSVFLNRWGDYTGAVNDPDDPNVVWLAQEYSAGDWATSIARVFFGTSTTITYHQTGACNGFVDTNGGHFAGANQAYVVFGIESIDNSGGANFAFDPANLYVQQPSRDFFDSSLSIYSLFGSQAVQATTLTSGQKLTFSPAKEGALIVSTANADGSTEANQTPYTLNYNRQSTDPPINLVKSNAAQTSWPNTQDCKTITLN
jgi:hypothetical protein